MSSEDKLQVILVRGGSGSGKTTWTRRHFPEGMVVSADRFFDRDGVYAFDRTKLGEAQAWCLQQFIEYCQKPPLGLKHLIVNNTNTRVVEVAPYAAVAAAYQHPVKIVTFIYDPVAAFKRNKHKTPLAICMRQYHNLQEGSQQMPPWWDHDYVLWDETWPYANNES